MKIFAILASVVVAAHALGEFTVLHSPESVLYRGQEQVDQSLLKEVLTSSVGFTTHKGSSWPGIRIANPFNYAEAVVVVVIDGVTKLGGVSGQTFPLNTDEDESKTWQSLSGRVLQRFPSQNNTLMRIELAKGNEAIEPYYNTLGDIETSIKLIAPLDPSISEDYQFATEVALMNEIARKIENGAIRRDGTPDVFWFVVSGLQSVITRHGANSAPAEKAESLLREALANVNDAFRASYNDQVVIATITTDAGHIRRTREAKPKEDPPANDLNLSKSYSSDYAVIFNIILWFSVAFTFAIIATAIAIGTMDPGRDSIIYRMTSNRMKKEN